MIGIIQDWLFSQLGINFNLNTLPENNIFQDGSFLVDILQKYGLIDGNYSVNITVTSDVEQCKKNLRLLKPVFDMLKVSYDEDVVVGIVGSKPATILKLLYELYVCLENKQHLYFITRQNYEKIQKDLIKNSHSYSVTENEVGSEIPFKSKNIPNNMCFEQPLIQNRDVIEWYKSKCKLVKENLDKRLQKIKEETPNKVEVSLKQKRKLCSCNYKESLDKKESLPNLDTFLKCSGHENLLSYDEFIASFKTKQHHNEARKCLENNIQNDLLQRTWSKVMEKENKIYNSVFSQIMLKQSQYEKQILTKLIQTQEQIKIQNANRTVVTNKILSEQEKQINCDFTLKEEFEKLEKIYEDEQKRVLELHRKLYKEKQDLIKKRHYSLCNDVMNALIDIAINASEYKVKYGVPVPKRLWNNWMQLFYKSQPVHIPFQKLESEVLQEDDIDYDDIIAFEKVQDDILNENDVDEYLFTCGRWFCKQVCIEHGDLDENILAFIVYRLLSLKYPPPASPLPAELPPFTQAGVLLNIYTPDCIEKLKVLLSKPRIHVFDTETAIKKSIATFKKETAPPVEENPKGKKKKSKSGCSKPKTKSKSGSLKRKSKDLKKKEKSDKKSSKKKTDKKKRKTEAVIGSEEDILSNFIDKETQTSVIKLLDESKPDRTPLGLIGEEVFNHVKSGEMVDDTLLVSVITEYLKTLEDIDGWLLLNYPLTLSQASVLELALTGKYLPMNDYVLEENIIGQEVQPDEFSEKRKSRLFPCPVSSTDRSSFKTHFTVFIKAKENFTQRVETPKSDYKNDSELQKENEFESRGSLENQETEDLQPDVLEVFYKDQGVFQDFGFDTCDLTTIKKLARTILKEDSEGAMGSVDLFGEEFLSKLTKVTKKGKKGKKSSEKKQKSSKKNKKKVGKEKTSSPESSIPNEKDITALEEEKLALDNNQIQTKTPENTDLQLRIINPGDEDWENVSLPINNDMAAILATMWENIENCYLNNLKDISFENRVINLRLVPYATYIQKEIAEIVNKPDLKQNLVNIFQGYYNSLQNNLRVLPDVKSQLHCKLLELQQSLWQIADDRKQETEKKRKDLIHENWLVTELCMLINNYLSLVETEFYRSVETLKLVSDYYFSMLDKTPPSTNANIGTNFPYLVKKLTIDAMLFIPHEVRSSGTLETKDNHPSAGDSDSIESEAGKNNFIAQSLINCYETEKIHNLLYDFLPNEIIIAKERLTAISTTFYKQIKTEADLLASAHKKSAKEKMSARKKERSPKANTEKSKKKDSLAKQKHDNNEKNDNNEKDVNNDISKSELLCKEWKFVVDTEIDRFNFRMDLIKVISKEDTIEFYCYLESVLCDLYASTLSRYDTDISNINKLSLYLKTAIEEETPIVRPLILSQDTFFININKNLKMKPEEAFGELLENTHGCYFTINQLNKLKNIFKIAGPFGVIRKQPFCYILQDLMLFNAGDNQPHLPKIWNLLTDSQLRTLVDTMFGPEYAIDWRDFLIYNLEIPYPTVDDILSLRKLFLSYDLEATEIVLLETYENTTLWFEEDLPDSPQEGLRIAMIKSLLFELFKVDENNINYTALLLYFCKDYDPKLGLRKALSLSLGKNVITSKEELNEILENEAEIRETVQSLLSDIVNSIVINREGVLIYEISASESSLNLSETGTSCTVSVLSDFSTGEDQLSYNSSSMQNESPNGYKGLISSLHLRDDDSFDKPWVLDKPWVSKVSVATVISVLNASFLHQDKTFSLRNQYLNCLEEEADEDGMIEAHVLVALSCIQNLFALTNKFKISSPCDILEHYLNVH